MDELVEVTRTTAELYAQASTNEDLAALARVQEALQAADLARSTELEKQRDILKGACRFLLPVFKKPRARTALTRQYETQKAAAQRPLTAPTEKQHREALSRLDDEKLQLGKKVTMLESDATSRESRLASTRAARADAERSEVEEDAAVDPDVFKLAILRGMGFIPLRDEAGKYNQMMIRNAVRPDVRLVACSEGKRADANQLWSLVR